MRRLLDKAPSLLVDSLFSLFWPAVGLGLVALILGRSAPGLDLDQEPAAKARLTTRTPASPRHVGIDGTWYVQPTAASLLLDRETGAISAVQAPDGRSLADLACSPWRDERGRYHLVGQCFDSKGALNGLARFTFPEDRSFRRIITDVLPYGNVCWVPDQGERILFSGFERRFYLLDLPAPDSGRNTEPARPRLVRWRTDPPGGEVLLQEDPCWPAIPALGGWLLATISYWNSPADPSSRTRIWWLKMRPDEATIVAAEPAIGVDETGPSPSMDLQGLPGVGVTPDGTPMLAYLARGRVEAAWDLWIAPIVPADAGRCPRVLASAARRLARGCSRALAPTFSADGRWVHAAMVVGGRFRLDRFAAATEE